jgi:hypothetical protein
VANWRRRSGTRGWGSVCRARLGLCLARDQDLSGLALSNVENVAHVAGRQGHAVKCARLLGAAATKREANGTTIEDPNWQAMTEAMIADARNTLGEEQWAAAFAEGRALSLEEAIAEALASAEEE